MAGEEISEGKGFVVGNCKDGVGVKKWSSDCAVEDKP